MAAQAGSPARYGVARGQERRARTPSPTQFDASLHSHRIPSHVPSSETEAWLMVKLASDRKQGDLSMLLKQQVDPNVAVRVEWREFATTPLVEAAVSGHTRVARMLLASGARVETSVGPGYTALYNASFNGHIDIVRLLLENGAYVNSVTREHFAPLYIACQEGYADCAKALLAAGADVDFVRPNEGATALYISSQHGHSGCVAALLASDVSIDLPMHDGSTPLMIACYMQHVRVVELLLRAGASLHALDKKGRSALDWAKKRGDALIIALVQEELAARGAAALRKGTVAEFFGGDSTADSAKRGCLGSIARALLPCLPCFADSGGASGGAKGGGQAGRGGCCRCFSCCHATKRVEMA